MMALWVPVSVFELRSGWVVVLVGKGKVLLPSVACREMGAPHDLSDSSRLGYTNKKGRS